jgi:hypothetical protein
VRSKTLLGFGATKVLSPSEVSVDIKAQSEIDPSYMKSSTVKPGLQKAYRHS